jgi:hypothetical protein
MNFDYNDEVQIENTTSNFNGKTGAVVGFTEVTLMNVDAFPGQALGTILCTVEFGDGSDALVPQTFLQRIEKLRKN